MTIQHRKEHGISCKNCSVAHLCLGSQIKSDELERIDKLIVNIAYFDKGQHIYHSQTKSDYLYAIRSGSCKEYSVDIEGKEYINNFYFAGDILGLEAIGNNSYCYSAVALEPVRVCMIPLQSLVSMLATTQDLPMRLLNIISNKVRDDSGIRLTSSAKQRVADFLLSISSRFTKRGYAVDELKLSIAQQDMSNKIGIAFETLSRILHAMQKDKIIAIQSRNVQIRDIEKLREISGGWEQPL